ncbi:hypothetical protein GBA52_008945 [Prunus armeniaca]|nr:hypothetical protein GBA52_008945 [Prunus armeniaca]
MSKVQCVLRLHPDQEGLSKKKAVGSKLGKYGLPSHNHLTPIAKLSGGQRPSVVFTSISMSRPYILLLDETTFSGSHHDRSRDIYNRALNLEVMTVIRWKMRSPYALLIIWIYGSISNTK